VRPESWFWDSLRRVCREETVVVAESYRLTPPEIAEQRELIGRQLNLFR